MIKKPTIKCNDIFNSNRNTLCLLIGFVHRASKNITELLKKIAKTKTKYQPSKITSKKCLAEFTVSLKNNQGNNGMRTSGAA